MVAGVADLPAGHGYNAATGEYGDLMAQGVIDPVKVTRSAVQNAASIAGMLLTTEVLVVEKPEQEQADAAVARPRARPLTCCPFAGFPSRCPAPVTAGAGHRLGCGELRAAGNPEMAGSPSSRR